jgi:nucleotide-binding universal stress UspA family protein
MTIKRIFVPTDFSTHSEGALKLGLEMARAFGARLQVFHCYQEVAGAGAPVGSTGLDSSAPENAEKQLKELVGRFDSEGIEVDLDLVPGIFPAAAVLEAARTTTADLIVMGTHGRTGLKHALLGSVAEGVVREASCPVTTVKGP